MCSHEIKMKDAGGQKVSAQPFPQAIGSHSLSPSLLHPSPLLPIPTRNTPIYLKLSTVSMTRQRVEWFCNSELIQSHICAFVRYFISANFQMCSEISFLNRNMMMMMTLAPGRAGQATRCQTMGPLVSNWPPPSHPSCFRVLSTSIDHPFHFISLLKEYCRTCN